MLLVLVGAIAVGAGHLGADTQLALPYGIGQHQLACQHVTVVFISQMDVTVFDLQAALRLNVTSDFLVPKPGAVEVDTQFTYLADVIGIGLMNGTVSLRRSHPLVDDSLQLVISGNSLYAVCLASHIE